MNKTTKLTARIPDQLNEKLSLYCKRKGISKEKATENAIRNMLSADEYMLEVARIALSVNAA